MSCIRPALFAVLTLMALILPAQAQLGRIFDGHQDVGIVLHPGSVLYAPATRSYTVAGSGENMWFGIDDFHFVWKKVSGDVVISASIAFVGAVGDPHRKAVLMMRQTLEGPSVAVDIAVHGSGLTSLQFRDATGGNTHEVQSNVSSPESVRLEKRGDFFYAFVAGKDHVFTPAGASIKSPSLATSTPALASAPTTRTTYRRPSSITSPSSRLRPPPPSPSSTAALRQWPSPPLTVTWNTSPRLTLKPPTGPATVLS